MKIEYKDVKFLKNQALILILSVMSLVYYILLGKILEADVNGTSVLIIFYGTIIYANTAIISYRLFK